MVEWDDRKQTAQAMLDAMVKRYDVKLDEFEAWQVEDLAFALADMADVTGVHWDDDTCRCLGFTFDGENSVKVYADRNDTADSPETLIVHAEKNFTQDGREFWTPIARINFTSVYGVYSDLDSTDAFASRVAYALGHVTPSGSYLPSETRMWTWFSSVDARLAEISDRNFETDGLFKYGMYVYHLPADNGYVLPEQFKTVLPTRMLQNRYIIMSTIGGAMSMSEASRRWDDSNYWSNAWTEQVIEDDSADCNGCFLDELYEGNINLEAF